MTSEQFQVIRELRRVAAWQLQVKVLRRHWAKRALQTGLSTRTVARHLGVSATTIGRWSRNPVR